MPRANYVRHVSSYGVSEDVKTFSGEDMRGRTKRRVTECHRCGKTLSYSNLARHRRSCRVWDPRGGSHPDRSGLAVKGKFDMDSEELL